MQEPRGRRPAVPPRRLRVLYGVPVKVLHCGHVAHQGERQVCRHLLSERAEELDTFWVLRGVGVEYDLCCAACGRASRHPELVEAREGCVARADDRSSVIGVIGEPEIRRRPEPVDGTLSPAVLPAAPLDVAPLYAFPGEWLLLTPKHLVRWNARTGEIVGRWKVRLPAADPERKAGKPVQYRLHASPGGEFAVIAADYRQNGAVVELRRGHVTMKLDRGTYHVEQTPFPVAFIRLDGQLLLVHATAWNRVDLSDPATGVTLTAREFHMGEGQRRPDHYLDYFYGALYPSPDSTLVVSDGWVWHPVGIPRMWDVRRWRYEDLTRPKTANRPGACARSATTGTSPCAGSITPGWQWPVSAPTTKR